MSLQRIPHDTTRYRRNPVELVNIANRQRIGASIVLETKVSPTMTANNAPSPYVVSGERTATVYLAMDGNLSTQWYGESGSNEWWKIDFGISTLVTGYKLAGYSGTNYPSAWTFSGSNNDSNWTTLDTKTGQVLSGSLSSLYSFTNTTSYRYYKFIFTAWYGAAHANVNEIELYGNTMTYHNYIGA